LSQDQSRTSRTVFAPWPAMYQAPSSRRPLPAIGPIGEHRGPWMAEIEKGGVVKGVVEISNKRDSNVQQGGASSSRALRRRQPVAGAPWESLSVQTFGRTLMDPELAGAPNAPSAMVLENPRGVMLQAVGQVEDHKVAGQMVSTIMKEQRGSAAPPGLALMPPTPMRLNSNSRGATPGSGSTSLIRAGGTVQVPTRRDRVSFGAVYEHRDSSGKPRLIGSTGVVPERQWQLDWKDSKAVRDLAQHADSAPGANSHLVWVGVGAGPVGEDEMQRVRQAVVEARSDRLRIEKLGSVKPYSSHT